MGNIEIKDRQDPSTKKEKKGRKVGKSSSTPAPEAPEKCHIN